MNDRSLLSPTALDLVFLLLTVIAVGSALLVVTTRQIVHAALWLVVSLGAIAACFLLMTAEFVAWMQVLIYVGAVVVILLFGLMLTHAPIGRSTDLTSANWFVAVCVAGSATSVLVLVLIDGFGSVMVDIDGATPATAQVVGESLFSHWVLAFEALSVLLLSALIGAIALSRQSSEE